MIGKILAKTFGSKNDRMIKQYRRKVQLINEFEAAIEPLSDSELAAKTVEFRERIAQGATVDELLPEAFAVVREAARRVLGERHYDVQLVGG
ncbi:MAG: preprotein translocase subunit SecA, partial [Desulfobulbus sp.]|nr:preprotein translocase subunit SecA [Desulfobulbus sp.]